jgi:hypothetical protein
MTGRFAWATTPVVTLSANKRMSPERPCVLIGTAPPSPAKSTIRTEGALNRVLTITMDGDELVSIVETHDS